MTLGGIFAPLHMLYEVEIMHTGAILALGKREGRVWSPQLKSSNPHQALQCMAMFPTAVI